MKADAIQEYVRVKFYDFWLHRDGAHSVTRPTLKCLWLLGTFSYIGRVRFFAQKGWEALIRGAVIYFVPVRLRKRETVPDWVHLVCRLQQTMTVRKYEVHSLWTSIPLIVTVLWLCRSVGEALISASQSYPLKLLQNTFPRGYKVRLTYRFYP